MDTFDKVSRLVEFATGEPYGDGMLVTSVISGYAEPGYGSNDSVIVLGDWNDKQKFHSDTNSWETISDMPSRLARSLERVGAEIEWLDEWTECQGCFRAVRTSGDSYSWKPFYAIVNTELLCADCLIDMGEDALDEYVNDSNKAISWCDRAHIESFGWVKYAPGDEQNYENGFYPGQNDEPATVFHNIVETMPGYDVIFFLDYTGQFDIGFSAFVKMSADTED